MMRQALRAGLVLLLLLLPLDMVAQQVGQPLPLWAGGAPRAAGEAPEDQPTMTPYLPAANPTGTGIVVFPGGGYAHLAVDHEGRQVAEWLNSLGVAAFVVQYRLGPKYHHPTMLGDAQRAIRLLRSRATEWGVNPQRVGVIGFSAGGHLASTAGTHFTPGDAASADLVERMGSRPDFMILVYPVITMQDAYTHRGSKNNLLGEQPEDALAWLLSNELQVTSETPPTFLVHTTDDAVVPVENSLMFYQALRVAGVPVEMHIYETGPHGFGLGGGRPVLSTWPDRARAWMESHGWLTGR